MSLLENYISLYKFFDKYIYLGDFRTFLQNWDDQVYSPNAIILVYYFLGIIYNITFIIIKDP